MARNAAIGRMTSSQSGRGRVLFPRTGYVSAGVAVPNYWSCWVTKVTAEITSQALFGLHTARMTYYVVRLVFKNLLKLVVSVSLSYDDDCSWPEGK